MRLLRSLVYLPLFISVIALHPAPGFAQAPPATGPVGAVDKLLGTASFLRAGQAPTAINLNDPTLRTDVLETDVASLLEVLLNDGSRIKLDENAQLTIAEYDTTATPVSLMRLARGRLRSTVSKTFSDRRDSFKIETNEGVLGVQGTTFDIIAWPDATEMFVYEGAVSATHIDPAFPDVKLVRAGETVRWKIDEPIPDPEKFCDTCAPADAPILVEPPDSSKPMYVGPRDKIGKEGLGSKAAKKAVGGLIGGLLGGRSSSSSSSKKPKTKRDPTRKLDPVSLKDGELDAELEMRSKFTEDGLLLSTKIEDFPDKGTFQNVFLEDCSGARLGPSKIEIYKIWSEAKLTVSWTKTTYVDGRQVSQESGGWTESWIFDSDILTRRGPDGLPEMPAIWKQMGYARSHAGLQHIGAYFNLTPAQLAEKGRVAAFAHITRPELDPVITAPFSAMITPGSDENVNLVSTTGGANAELWEQWNEECVKPRPLIEVVPVAEPAADPDAPDEPDQEPDQDLPTCEDLLNTPWPAEAIELEKQRQAAEQSANRSSAGSAWGGSPVVAADDDEDDDGDAADSGAEGDNPPESTDDSENDAAGETPPESS